MDVKFTNNNFIAVSPLPPETANAPTRNISSLMSRNEDLKPLKIVFAYQATDMTLWPDDEVFLRPESYTSPYMNQVLQTESVKFILIPKEAVILYKRK